MRIYMICVHVRMDVVCKRPVHALPMALLLTQHLVSNSEYQHPSHSHSHSSQSQSRALPGASIVLALVPLHYPECPNLPQEAPIFCQVRGG